MLSAYEENKNKTVETKDCFAVVSGFHFAWDDSDFNYLIAAVIKPKDINYTGLKYPLKGDVHKTRTENNLGFILINEVDFEKHGLTINYRNHEQK